MTPMRSALALLAFCASILAHSVVAAQTDHTLVHTVRTQETWASIADLYYGNAKLGIALQTENGLRGEESLRPGMRLMIPKVSFHLTEDGDTWRELATHYYRNPERAFAIAEANGASDKRPPSAGAYLVIPYPLRHDVRQGETVRDVAKAYYNDLNDGIRRLRRFNGIRGQRLQRGEILLVPMDNLRLSEQGQQAAEQQGMAAEASSDKLEKQQRINKQLPELSNYVRNGHYIAAVAMANRLLGKGDLTGNQIVSIQRDLGTALVALGETQMAIEAFTAAVKQQPDMEMDTARTSPTVQKVFTVAQQEAKQEMEQATAPAVESVPVKP